MAYTGPRGKPRSGPQRSYTYCDMARCGSRARAGPASAATQASTHAARMRWSGEKFEFLNDHLDVISQRVVLRVERVEIQTYLISAGRWYAGGEGVGCALDACISAAL